jgi:N-ethylmaleimide reductase
MTSLFDPIQAGELRLPNRIAMAPLTRNRAPRACTAASSSTAGSA